jgi:hypothetical protein
MSQQNEGKEQLKEILERSEYQVYEQETQKASQRLIDMIGQWVKGLLETWFPNFHVTGSTINGWIYFFGLIGVGLLIFLIVKLLGRLSGEKKLSEKRAFSSVEDLAWSQERHWQQADDLASKGQRTEAARHLFLGMLLNFDNRGLVEAKSWKTNGDYYKELAGLDKRLEKDFGELALLFDQITYGNRILEHGEYEDFREQAVRWVEDKGGRED